MGFKNGKGNKGGGGGYRGTVQFGMSLSILSLLHSGFICFFQVAKAQEAAVVDEDQAAIAAARDPSIVPEVAAPAEDQTTVAAVNEMVALFAAVVAIDSTEAGGIALEAAAKAGEIASEVAAKAEETISEVVRGVEAAMILR